jgi:hypothetical protein
MKDELIRKTNLTIIDLTNTTLQLPDNKGSGDALCYQIAANMMMVSCFHANGLECSAVEIEN